MAATATVSYRAEIADLRKQLEGITGVTRAEARKMVTELNKSMRAVERQNKRTVHAFKSTGDAAGDAESSIRAISGAIGMVNPQAEKFLNVFAELGGATEGVTRGAELLGVSTLPKLLAVLSPLVALVGVGAVHWKLYSDEQARANRVQELTVETTEMLRSRSEALISTTLDMEVAVGNLTEKERQLLRVRRETFLESLPQLQKLTQAITEQEEHVRKLEKAQSGGAGLQAGAYMAQAGAQKLVNENLEKERDNLKALETNRTRLLESIRTQVGAQADLLDAQEAAEEQADRERRSRSDANSQARKEAQERERLERERASALAELVRIQEGASLSVLDGEARVTEELKRQLEVINELEQASGDAEAASQARQAVAIEYEHRIAKIREQNAERAARDDAKRAQEVERQRQEAMRASIDLAQMATSSLSEGFGAAYDIMLDDVARLQDYQTEAGEHLTEAQKKELDKRIQDQKRAARNAFAVQQGAASAEAAINTALAVGKAATGAPPPLNIPLMALAAAQGLAQQRAIYKAQPTFHQGGAVDLAPDEVQATVRQREFVLNPTGRSMMGDDDLHRANAGQSARGGDVVAVSVYKHTRQVDRWKRDGLNAGDPIARAIGRGKLVGHRSRG